MPWLSRASKTSAPKSRSGSRRTGIPSSPSAEWWDILARSGLRGADVPRRLLGQGLAARPRDGGAARRSPSTARSVRPRASATCSPRRRSSRTATSASSKKTCSASSTGQDAWCQLFSEPGAGSDLASLTHQGGQGRRRVASSTGQKVWTSTAQHQQRRHADRAHRSRSRRSTRASRTSAST